ncbi:MAG: alpha/beta fold hydrolase [Candidatus Tectomicrobia bacterium]|nr:alpha/beta fold hydrolase [Candidatus Tectomicrobia bacterium]
MPKVPVNGIEVYYEAHGRGDPVLLLTGLGGVGANWGPQVALFAKEFLTVVPDHRGAGRSSHPEDGYTIEQHASDMAELLRSLKCGPAHIVGSSTGGAIAQVMALDQPDVVRSITLSSSWARTDDFFRQQFGVRKAVLKDMGPRALIELNALFLWAPSYVRAHYGRVREWIEKVAAAPARVEVMIKRIDMILAHDQLGRLGGVRKPALVIVGKEDACTPPFFSEELASAIPGAELAVLEGGHFFYSERPEGFHRRVREFLLKH